MLQAPVISTCVLIYAMLSARTEWCWSQVSVTVHRPSCEPVSVTVHRPSCEPVSVTVHRPSCEPVSVTVHPPSCEPVSVTVHCYSCETVSVAVHRPSCEPVSDLCQTVPHIPASGSGIRECQTIRPVSLYSIHMQWRCSRSVSRSVSPMNQ